MLDFIELYLVWLLLYIQSLYVELFKSCWGKFCIKKDCIIIVCFYFVLLMVVFVCNGWGYIYVQLGLVIFRIFVLLGSDIYDFEIKVMYVK